MNKSGEGDGERGRERERDQSCTNSVTRRAVSVEDER